MEDENKIIINKLPSKTWYWLRVNETSLPWDEEHETVLPEENVEAGRQHLVRFSITGTKGYSRKQIHIHAERGTETTVLMDYDGAGHLAVNTELTVEEGAAVRLIQLQHSKDASVIYNRVWGECADHARIQLVQIYLGKGDIYSDTTINLSGKGSSYKSDIGYVGQQSHIIDMNAVVNQIGKNTESEITVNGALRDASKKIFRGTIDFKTGAAGSVGNEQETVLILGDEVENKTVPVILCSEENVVGNHGATIGELDEETLFYFESRGIGKEQAESIMARAGIDRLKPLIGDEAFEKMIDAELGAGAEKSTGLGEV